MDDKTGMPSGRLAGAAVSAVVFAVAVFFGARSIKRWRLESGEHSPRKVFWTGIGLFIFGTLLFAGNMGGDKPTTRFS